MNCYTRYYCTTPRWVCRPNNTESNRASTHLSDPDSTFWDRSFLISLLSYLIIFALDQLRRHASQKIWRPFPLSALPIPLSVVRSCRVKPNKGNPHHSGDSIAHCPIARFCVRRGERKKTNWFQRTTIIEQCKTDLATALHPMYLQQAPTSRIIC